MTSREIYWGVIRLMILGAMIWAGWAIGREHPYRLALTCFFAAMFGATARAKDK